MKAHVVTILPHVGCFGGVRRFIELGNEFIRAGHEFTICATQPKWDGWMRCDFEIQGMSKPPKGTHVWGAYGVPAYLEMTFDPKFSGERWLWIVAGSKAYTKAYQDSLRTHPWYGVLLNNRKFNPLYRGIAPNAFVVTVESGVNTSQFKCKKFRVGYYGAEKRSHKNCKHIRESLSGLSNVELVPIYGLKDRELAAAYRTLDFFVAWEEHGGWSGTAAEALASGIQVVTNGVNCEPFLEHCRVVTDLRGFFEDLGRRMEKFSWRSSFQVISELMGVDQ